MDQCLNNEAHALRRFASRSGRSFPITPSDLVLYRSPKGVVKVGVLVRDETVWLTQRALSELFAVGVPAIARHLKNIFDSGELEASATVSRMEMVQREITRAIEFYNLDAKNYLSEEETSTLAENRARRGILMKMADWVAFLNQVLELQAYPILADKGRVSALEAKLKAEAEYGVFRVHQDREFVSDFDRVVEEARRLGEGPKPKKGTPRRGKKA